MEWLGIVCMISILVGICALFCASHLPHRIRDPLCMKPLIASLSNGRASPMLEMSRSLLDIGKRSLPWLTLRGAGLASEDVQSGT